MYWYWLTPALFLIGTGLAILSREQSQTLVEWWRTRDRALLRKADRLVAEIWTTMPADIDRRRERLAIVKHLREEVLPRILTRRGKRRPVVQFKTSFLISVLEMILNHQLDQWDDLVIHYQACVQDARNLGIDSVELDLNDIGWVQINAVDRPGRVSSQN